MTKTDSDRLPRLGSLNGPAVAALAVKVAVLPCGALEHHGRHLPLETDTIVAEAILDRTGRRRTGTPVLRLPALWLGASAEHAGFPGTLSQSPEALIGQVVAVGGGLRRLGVDRLVLLNGHGGNVAALDIAALRLRGDQGMLVVNLHWLDMGLPPDLAPPSDPGRDWHGGWIETSVLLAIRPELVDRSALTDHAPCGPALLQPTGPYRWGWRSEDISPTGVIGNATGATAEIGDQLLDHAAGRLNALLDDLSRLSWSPAS